jgi:hypothetical protein
MHARELSESAGRASLEMVLMDVKGEGIFV